MANIEKENDTEWKSKIYEQNITYLTSNSLYKQEEALNKIMYYYQNFAPISLYKYYSDKQMNFDNVKTNKMWFSIADMFNDVFDGILSFDVRSILKSAWEQIPNNDMLEVIRLNERFNNEMNNRIADIKAAFEKMRRELGIACFSESCQSLLMWAHYANNHRGICVQYNMRDMISKYNITPMPIIYSDKKTVIKSLNMKTLEKDGFGYSIRSILSKSREWSYEKEWRAINTDIALANTWRENKTGALFDMIPPSSIILGCQATSDFENQVKEYCESSKINLYKMEKDEYEYKLNRKPILEF